MEEGRFDDPFEYPIDEELDLHTFPVKELKKVVQEYLYQCHLKGFTDVRIVHGKGIGTQRRMVREILEKSPYVLSFSEPSSAQGGWGATMVRLGRKEG
ncbi:MAG: Smr/MutS family protein [bacterium]|nr:Smr/MutS family protein [bacterium]